MKKFVQQFVPEYSRISGMNSFAEHDINRRFLFINGAILSTIGLIVFLMVGWIFHLLDNRSYIFYGYNIIFIIVLFILIYSTEFKRHEDINGLYSIWVIIIARVFKVMDAMVVMWSLMFFLFKVQLFTGLEGTIFNIVVIVYLLISIVLRRQFGSIFIGVPLVFILASMLLFLSAFPMIIQYGLSLLFVSLVFYLKDNVGISLFTSNTPSVLLIAVVPIILFTVLVRENDVLNDTFEPLGNTVIELSSDQTPLEIIPSIQYFGYSFNTRYENDYSFVNVYDDQFKLVTSYQIDTTEYLHLDVNYQDDTVLITFSNNEDETGRRTYEINSSLELIDLGIVLNQDLVSYLNHKITDTNVKGTVVFQNLNYIITDEGDDQGLHIYKRLDSTYEYQGDITRELFLGYYEYSYTQTLYMIDDFFIFGRNLNNEELVYVIDTSGNIIGGSYTKSDNYRGNETYFSRSNYYLSNNNIYGIYYHEDGMPIIAYSDLVSSNQLYDVKTLYRSNLSLGITLNNNIEVASLFLLAGLLIPISKKEEE